MLYFSRGLVFDSFRIREDDQKIERIDILSNVRLLDDRMFRLRGIVFVDFFRHEPTKKKSHENKYV